MAARLEARVASRRGDLRAAAARGASALADKVAAEVEELEAYLEAVTAASRGRAGDRAAREAMEKRETAKALLAEAEALDARAEADRAA